MRKATAWVLLGVGVIGLALFAAGRGWLGHPLQAGSPSRTARPADALADSANASADAARSVGARGRKQILFGDFHVHTGFSADAFTMSLPLTGGSGAHTVADACDFARFCSGLDFWSINDHAESSTPRRWRETVDAVRQCDAVAGEGAAAGDADLVSFLGWEWSHMGTTAENHYGHRNVILRDLDDARIPTRPIASDSPADYFRAPRALTLGLLPVIAGDTSYLSYATYLQENEAVPRCDEGVPVRELPADCREYAASPGALLQKLDDWGHASIVVPHGTTWGMYTPQGSSWAKQLTAADHDPVRQRLVEVYSGHGNIEEYRAWRAVEIAPDGTRRCPAPSPGYLPSCWQAGSIIAARCRAAGTSATECEALAARARQLYADAPAGLGHLSVPGYDAMEWRDAGQCRDCFLPAFNYRPASSVQAMLALSRAEEPRGEGEGQRGPRRLRFGFIGSSDSHTARPGTGYEESQRTRMSDARMARVELPGPERIDPPLPEPRVADPQSVEPNHWIERGRAGSFYYTGGLVAVHAERRDRDGIWTALERRETYATSGPRILLWFDLLNPPASEGTVPMGGEVAMDAAPVFDVRAIGSLESKPGCADFATDALGAERLERLCGGDCYQPSDTRRVITRVEVVRIRPQREAGEALHLLIDDPWIVLPCPGDPSGCAATFSDPDFTASRRDTVYYVRAVEAPSDAVNGGTLRCQGDDCHRMTPCTPWAPATDDCLSPVEERAWSSPIFVDWGTPADREDRRES